MRRAKRFIIVMGVLAGLLGVGAAVITGFLLSTGLGEELNPLSASRFQSPLLFYSVPLIWMVIVYAVWMLPLPDLTRITMATTALAAAAIDFSLNVAVLAYPAMAYWLGLAGVRLGAESALWNYIFLPIAVSLGTFLMVIGSFVDGGDENPP